MSKQIKELPIPESALSSSRAIELLRVWAAGGKQHVTIAAEVFGKDPACWGIMLVDLAKHVSRAYEQSGKMDESEALKRIRQGFDAEWSVPTDTPTGKILE